jgi:peptide/nickel transport system substrate-binding protein
MKKKNVAEKMLTLTVASCVLVFIAFGCAAASTPVKQTEGVLKIGSLRDARVLDITKILSVYEFKMISTAVEPLFRVDKKYRPVPWLVTAFKLSPDMLNLTLTLRKGVKFHDGSDFNASVVKFNLDRFMKSGSVHLNSLKQVDVVDAYTVRLVLSQPDSTLANRDVGSYTLALSPGLMMSEKAFETNGEEWCNKHPIGTGPFKFVDWQRDVFMKFQRFDGYWQKGKPYLAGVEWLTITDPLSAAAAFKKGEIDVLLEPDASQLDELRASNQYKFLTFQAGVTGLVGDSAHKDSPFSDVRVRQAVSHAIDIKSLSKLGVGLWAPTNQLDLNTAGLAYNPQLKGYPYNPQKAKTLLAEAGYPKGFKTRLIGDAGRDDQWLTAVQADLKKVGIDAEVDLVTQAARTKYTQEGWKNGLLRFSLAKKTADTAPEARNMLHSRSTQYVSMLHSSVIDDLFVEALHAPNYKTKLAAMRKLASTVVDKECQVNILYGMEFAAVKNIKVHDESIWEFGSLWWTPEDAWREK